MMAFALRARAGEEGEIFTAEEGRVGLVSASLRVCERRMRVVGATFASAGRVVVGMTVGLLGRGRI